MERKEEKREEKEEEEGGRSRRGRGRAKRRRMRRRKGRKGEEKNEEETTFLTMVTGFFVFLSTNFSSKIYNDSFLQLICAEFYPFVKCPCFTVVHSFFLFFALTFLISVFL